MAGKTRYIGALRRYPEFAELTSERDPFASATLQLEFLAVEDYVIELMDSRHSITPDDAAERAASVRAHVGLALQYLEQAQSGPREVCFVPCYYALLNLMKVYILFSDLRSRLATNRWHGASYAAKEGAATALPSDQITLSDEGTIPLFYRVLTGKELPSRTNVSMADVYPFIQDISAEWGMACPDTSRIVQIGHSIEKEGGVRYATHQVFGRSVEPSVALKTLPALAKCVPQADAPGVFRGPAENSESDDWSLIESGVDRRFLYHTTGDVTTTAVMDGPILMPEELPIALAFFHLSSVARYHPELLERFRASRYWPAIAALRDHAVYKFLLLSLSFIRRAHVAITRPTRGIA